MTRSIPLIRSNGDRCILLKHIHITGLLADSLFKHRLEDETSKHSFRIKRIFPDRLSQFTIDRIESPTLSELLTTNNADGIIDRDGITGARAQALMNDGRLVDDFSIVNNQNSIHVCNAPSPAVTSSLKIGKAIAEQQIALWAKRSQMYR